MELEWVELHSGCPRPVARVAVTTHLNSTTTCIIHLYNFFNFCNKLPPAHVLWEATLITTSLDLLFENFIVTLVIKWFFFW